MPDGSRPASTVTPLRGIALLVGAAVVVSLLVRLVNPWHLPGPTASDAVPHLWGIGAMVVVVLAYAWAPTLSWVAAIIASTTAALGMVGYVRQVRATGPGFDNPVADTLLAAVLVVPLIAAGAYATSGPGRPRWMLLLTWAAIAAMAAVFAVNAARRALGDDTGGVPQWTWLLAIGFLTLLGLVRDVRPAVAHTRERLAAGGSDPGGSGRRLSALRVFVDELVPGRDAGRVEAAETERSRLAADLHAEVLPSLRRALAEAEQGGTIERLAADLRTAVDEVEALLVARRSIVLEELGLLAGIEWLAERVEERSSVRVEIEVLGAPADDSAVVRPPREVERAAFRVAHLALDNVVRHAPGSTARVAVEAARGSVSIRVADDGDGQVINEAAAARAGRRGLADMRAEARACGAALEIGRDDGGRGTAVTFRWHV